MVTIIIASIRDIVTDTQIRITFHGRDIITGITRRLIRFVDIITEADSKLLFNL